MNRILLWCLMLLPNLTYASLQCLRVTPTGATWAQETVIPLLPGSLSISGTSYLNAILYDANRNRVPSAFWRVGEEGVICTSDSVFQECATIAGSYPVLDEFHRDLPFTYNRDTLTPGGPTFVATSIPVGFTEGNTQPYNPPYSLEIRDSFNHVLNVPLLNVSSTTITTATWNVLESYTFHEVGPGETTVSLAITGPEGASGTLQRLPAPPDGVTLYMEGQAEPNTLIRNDGQTTNIYMTAAQDAIPGTYSRMYEATLNCP